MRVPIRTKLLTALGVLVALLVALGGVSLVVLGQANARVERLVELQARTTAYSDLRVATADQLYDLAKAMAAPDAPSIDSVRRKIALTAYNIDRLQFVTHDQADLVARVAGTQADFATATARALDLLSAGRIIDAQRTQTVDVAPLADRLELLTNQLVNVAEAEVAQSAVDARDAYARSQIAVVMFAGASLLLALLLGLALAFAIIGPLRAIGLRVGRIAEGDFNGHLAIENGDELGALAANVDRMSAQLRSLYEGLADQERLRLARDLHDLLGHSLSLIAIKSQLARRLLAAGDTARAGGEISDIERVARESLQDVRHAVDGYRQPGLVSTIAGARSALAAAKIASTIEIGPEPLPTKVDAVLAWGVREAITNVIRHSGAAACSIRLTRDAQEARLEIADDGPTIAVVTPGNGLRGLQERLAVHGGRVDAGPLPSGGFRLQMSVPL